MKKQKHFTRSIDTFLLREHEKLMLIFFGESAFLRDVEKIHEFSLHHEPINGQFR